MDKKSLRMVQALLVSDVRVADDTLQYAMISSEDAIVDTFLKAGVEPSQADLVEAIFRRSKVIAHRILSKNIHLINESLEGCIDSDYHVWTPLAAAIDQDFDVQYILAQCPDFYDCSAVISAVYRCWAESRDSISVIQQLLERRSRHSQIQCRHEGTALAIALLRNDHDVLRLLEEYGIDIDTHPETFYWPGWTDELPSFCKFPSPLADWRQRTAIPEFERQTNLLISAIEANSETLIRQLLSHGFQADGAALEAASKLAQPHIFELLLEAGANTNDWVSMQRKVSLLGSACERGDAQSVRNLLALGATVDECGGIQASSLAHTALQICARDQEVDIIEILFEIPGLNVNEPASPAGATALQWAAMTGNIALTKRLLDLGADPNAKGGAIAKSGRTALQGAAESGRLETVHLLLASGIRSDGDFRIDYVRAVWLATCNGRTAIAHLLRSHIMPSWSEEDEACLNGVAHGRRRGPSANSDTAQVPCESMVG
jgi:ankyrin repeat protein